MQVFIAPVFVAVLPLLVLNQNNVKHICNWYWLPICNSALAVIGGVSVYGCAVRMEMIMAMFCHTACAFCTVCTHCRVCVTK